MSTKLHRSQPRSFVGPKPSIKKSWMERDDIQWQVSTFSPAEAFLGSEPLRSSTLAPGRQRRFDQPQVALKPKSLSWIAYAANLAQTPAEEHIVAPECDAAIRATTLVRTDRLQSLESLAQPLSTKLSGSQAQELGPNELARQFKQLLAEAAHDIRSPIASASQIIDAVSRNAASSGVAASDVELLRVAQNRLAQASNWTARILADRRLEGLFSTQSKRRFYPAQWKSLLQPLLHFVAKEHGVRLLWIDWDRSLPKLYLDPGLLSRSMLNLVTNAVQACEPGDQVSIRAAWSSDRASRFVIHVEDQGPGMSLELLQALNRSGDFLSAEPAGLNPTSSVGLGLAMTKTMVRQLGGNLTAQNCHSKGTSLRLSLPTDDLTAQLRAWLLRMDAAAPRTGAKRTFSLFGLRTASGDPLAVDQQISNFVGEEDLLYRFSRNGWLYYSARPVEEVRQSIDGASRESRECSPTSQLDALRLATIGTRILGGRQSDFGAEKVNLGIPAFAEQLSRYAQPLIRKAVPAVDDLQAEFDAGFRSTLKHLSPKSAAPTRVDVGREAKAIRRPHTLKAKWTLAEPGLKEVAREDPQEDFSRSLKRIAKNLRATQASLQATSLKLPYARNAS